MASNYGLQTESEDDSIDKLIAEAEKIIDEHRSNIAIANNRRETLRREVDEVLLDPPIPGIAEIQTDEPPLQLSGCLPSSVDDVQIISVQSPPAPVIIDLSTPESQPSNRRCARMHHPIIAVINLIADDEASLPKKQKSHEYSDVGAADISVDESSTVSLKCPVCFEAANKRKPVSTACGHIFCQACIQKVVKMSKKCPICRKPVNQKSLINLHF